MLRGKFYKLVPRMAIDRWAVVSVSMMERTSKNILYVSHVIISTIASSRISSGLLGESSFVEDLLKSITAKTAPYKVWQELFLVSAWLTRKSC